jgi:hypothetical protein
LSSISCKSLARCELGKARGQGHWPIKERAKPVPLKLKRKTHLFKTSPKRRGTQEKETKAKSLYGVKAGPPATPIRKDKFKKVSPDEGCPTRLLDYLECGETLDEFPEQFPGVSREQAIAALEEAKALVLTRFGK